MQATVTGALTMLGKTEEVSAPCKVDVSEGGLHTKCEFKIDRTRWGMTYGQGRVDNEVEIVAQLVLSR